MTKRSARSPKGRSRGGAAAHAGEILTRQRMVAGGVTAFAIAFSYVAVNAMWYQPRAHTSAFFATRAPSWSSEPQQMASSGPASAEPSIETVIRLEAQEEVPAPSPAPRTTTATPPEPQPSEQPAVAAGDDRVRVVQEVLAGLNLYSGSVDGLNGPQTREAIEAYQKKVGIDVTGEIDANLLRQLGRSDMQAIPVPQAAPEPATDQIQTASAAPIEPDRLVMRIQAGLKAFGNDGIEIDGMVGEETVSALREFQSLFGLPVTGEPDAEVYAKMKEIGLTN